ncbi:hypothetical protein [Streptomyces mirabilis]|uniref:hypothetical protein n=1 Tax=Streptomyces mirabilis TaxID=68239 RepID=UPI00369E2A97
MAITDVHGASALRTAGIPGGMEDQVRLYVVGRGAWTLDGPPDRGEHTVARPSRFRTAPRT